MLLRKDIRPDEVCPRGASQCLQLPTLEQDENNKGYRELSNLP